MTLAPFDLTPGWMLALTMIALVGQAQTRPDPLPPEPSAGASITSARASDAAPGLPPPPEGVVDLGFADFFKSPVGARGLELTDRLRGLDGKRVRLRGHMVRQTEPTPGRFLLSPQPVSLHEHEYGMADELPAAIAHVFLAETNASAAVAFTPGALLVTGTLSVGHRVEPSERISLVRLRLDPPAAPRPENPPAADRECDR